MSLNSKQTLFHNNPWVFIKRSIFIASQIILPTIKTTSHPKTTHDLTLTSAPLEKRVSHIPPPPQTRILWSRTPHVQTKRAASFRCSTAALITFDIISSFRASIFNSVSTLCSAMRRNQSQVFAANKCLCIWNIRMLPSGWSATLSSFFGLRSSSK